MARTASRLSPRFEDALTLAARLHAGQLRKGTRIPYVAHLLGVASLALEAIAALLHDAVEDQDLKPAELRRRFGERVTEIVLGCTDARARPKPPWRKRKERYLRHLRHASPSVRLVSGCDKLHNARAILGDYRAHGERLWKRFSGRREGTLWYYREVVRRLRAHRTTPLVAELARVVAELEQLVAARGA